MIGAIDIETRGLNAQAFILGCVKFEDSKMQCFSDKNQLWKYVLDYAYKEAKRGHNTYLYAHNHKFDFYGYADLMDPKLVYRSSDPFIVDYDFGFRSKKKPEELGPCLHFYDSMALSRCALSKVGYHVGQPKMEMPHSTVMDTMSSEEILSDMVLTSRLKTYCENDVSIVLKFLDWSKETLAKDDIRVKDMVSVSQIGLKYILKYIDKHFPDDFL